MSYGRIERGPMAADNFTQISNSLFRDPRLSAKAKGVFGFISTHRSGWGVTPESIAACMTDGVSAVKGTLRELEQYGYLVRSQDRQADGTLGPMQYQITDLPRSGPVDENRPPVPTCEDVETCRSEPVDGNPPAVNPPAENHPHKKTSSKKTIVKNTSSSPVAPSGPSVGQSEEPGGGGGDAPQQQEQRAAAAFVDLLPFRGPVPGPKARTHLVERVRAALGAGWGEDDLRRQLTADTSTAKSMAAVFRYRLDPENLPAPPVPTVLPVQRATPRRPTCPDCQRPLTNSSVPTLCRECREAAALQR